MGPQVNAPGLGGAGGTPAQAQRHLLARWAVPVPAARVVGSAEEAAAAAGELGYPVVVKALGVAHKTEVGGVRIDLGSAVEVSAAAEFWSSS